MGRPSIPVVLSSLGMTRWPMWWVGGCLAAMAGGCVAAEEAQAPGSGEGGAILGTGGVGAASATGGAPATGATATGGVVTTGGQETGGGLSGGTGGVAIGGTATGGAALGGSATGGEATGGIATGGTDPTGGALILLGGGPGDGGSGGGTVPLGSNPAADCETVSLGCSEGWPFDCDSDPGGGCTDEIGYFCCEPGCAPASSRAADCTNPAFPNPYLCHSSQVGRFDGCETVGSLVCCP